MLASRYGHTETVNYLIKAKASLDLQMQVYWILGWKIVNLTVNQESGDNIICWRFEKFENHNSWKACYFIMGRYFNFH